MSELFISANDVCGRMKPMHAVNNGPVHTRTPDHLMSNLDAFREAGIPYARTHDSSINYYYGGEHCVDISAVFPNFDADPEDPASYDFTITDEFLATIRLAGTEPFYRLGSKIEHWVKKYGTLVPKDFKKWAVIAEHIIAHYTEGFADGFRDKIEYWEIWNEPDFALDDADPFDKKTWGGTCAQFCEFFDVAAQHLKARFPHLKIGGPAICFPYRPWFETFLAYLKAHGTPLDFFSWHIYTSVPETLIKTNRYIRDMLNQYGYTETELILDEWNYVTSFLGEELVYTRKAEKGLKGAAYTAAVMSAGQYEPLDMLMYYDARPCGMNGLFDSDFLHIKLKGYYPFYFFNQLYRLGTAVKVRTDDTTIYASAAKNEESFSLMLTYFKDVDAAESKVVAVNLRDMPFDGAYEVIYHTLDVTHDGEVTLKQILSSKDVTLYVNVDLFTTVWIEAKKL